MSSRESGVVVYRNSLEACGIDAIDEYSRRLTGALCEAGSPASYVDRGLTNVLAGAPPRWILLQYNPFSYGRRGFAPGLLRDAMRVRRRWPQAPFVVTVHEHEAWVRSMSDWRSTLMGAYQRAQMRLLLRMVDGVIVVRETLGRELGTACTHIPVGSNITPVPVTAEEARARLGLSGMLVLALFGRGNPARALDHAESAIEALSSARGADGICVLNLGSGSPIPAVPAGVQIRTPGALSGGELSLHLRASELLLLPFTDGMSTRRTTLMAGLAHGLPVIGLQGVNTDRILIQHIDTMVLTPCGDVDAYAHAVVRLILDPTRRQAVGRAGRSLYERNFDWPVLAQMVLKALSDASAARRAS